MKNIIFDVMSKELLTFLKCCNPTILLSARLTLGFKASLFVERADPNPTQMDALELGHLEDNLEIEKLLFTNCF